MRHFDQAAVFAESCFEYKLVKKIKDTTPLIEAVSLEYAHYLNSLSLKEVHVLLWEGGRESFFNTCTKAVLDLHTSAFYSFNSGGYWQIGSTIMYDSKIKIHFVK